MSSTAGSERPRRALGWWTLLARPPGLAFFAGLVALLALVWQAMAWPSWSAERAQLARTPALLTLGLVFLYLGKAVLVTAFSVDRRNRRFDLVRWAAPPLLVIGCAATSFTDMRLHLFDDPRVGDTSRVDGEVRAALDIAAAHLPRLNAAAPSGSWVRCGASDTTARLHITSADSYVPSSEVAGRMQALAEAWAPFAVEHGWALAARNDLPQLSGRGYEIEVEYSGGVVDYFDDPPPDPPRPFRINARGPCVHHEPGPI